MDKLIQLAELIEKRNLLEQEITAIIGRPADIGHIGEYVASKIFNIALEQSASYKAIDGRFSDGILEGRSVNIKWYALQEGLLDITPDALPDYYLVLTGPKSGAGTSRRHSRPWAIEGVFLFDAQDLVARLRHRGLKIGIATSVRQQLWREAEIYPLQNNDLLNLSAEQRKALTLFRLGLLTNKYD
jgi:hypothetical protein